MIKFGSRTEIYLAKSPALRVAVGQGERVRGGISVLATYCPDGPIVGPSDNSSLEVG